MLDTDCDGRGLYPRQLLFPMAGDKEGWARPAKNLEAQIGEDLIEATAGVNRSRSSWANISASPSRLSTTVALKV